MTIFKSFSILIILFLLFAKVSAKGYFDGSIDFIKNDSTTTLHAPQNGTTTLDNSGFANFSKLQDSVYELDTRIRLNSLFWLKRGLTLSESQWTNYLFNLEHNPTNAFTNSISKMPSNIFAPLPSEVVQYQIGKINALSIPTVTTYTEDLTHFNLRSIGLLLGIVEDVSPEIKYTLAITADVEVVIYSVSAKLIATIFTGTQKPGKYNFYWNGKDDAGKKMPFGDYIAEVRIGSERFVRKRIVIE
jgi:hypothetical protein